MRLARVVFVAYLVVIGLVLFGAFWIGVTQR